MMNLDIFDRMAPDTNIVTQRLPEWKNEKDRISLMPYFSADGSRRFELVLIGKSCKPRWFGRNTGKKLGFDYHVRQHGNDDHTSFSRTVSSV